MSKLMSSLPKAKVSKDMPSPLGGKQKMSKTEESPPKKTQKLSRQR